MARRKKDEDPAIAEAMNPETEQLETDDAGQVLELLGNLSVQALASVIEEASGLRRRKVAGQKRAVIDRVRAELAAFGIAQADLFGRGSSKSSKSRSQPAVKFRDPSNPENTWSGRGRVASWVAEYEKQGKNRDEFLVDRKEAAE